MNTSLGLSAAAALVSLEKSGARLAGGVKVAPDILSKYAGAYELNGREIVVSVAGDQLMIQDSSTPADRLFVARSETVFLSSLSQVAHASGVAHGSSSGRFVGAPHIERRATDQRQLMRSSSIRELIHG